MSHRNVQEEIRRNREEEARQLEEATRDTEPPLVSTVEMEVEQPQEHPMTGGASSSSGPATSRQ